MAEKNNATCSICGKDYYVCLSCRDSIKANPWKIYTDTSEHYKVFQVVRGYTTKVYTKDEARTKLKNISLDDIESFMPHIKQIVKDILKEEKVVTKVVEKVEKLEEPIVEEFVRVEPVQEEVVIEENAVIEKPAVSRKRSYKTEVE